MASFCAVLFPLDVLDEIWDLIESVSEGFLTYFSMLLIYAVSDRLLVFLMLCTLPIYCDC